MKREEYLQKTIDQIRCEKAKEGVKKELENHIDDQKEAFQCEGMTETEAEEAAVLEMGDPVETGIGLDRVHRPKMAWNCIFLIGLLYLVGFVLQYFLGMQAKESNFGPGGSLTEILGYAGKLLAGFAVMITICYVDYSRLAKWIRQIWVLYSVILLLGLTVFGTRINGSNFWIYGMVNAKLLAFLFLPLYGGILFWYRGKGAGGILKVLLWGCIPVLICLGIPGVTTAALLVFLMLLMLSLAVSRGWYQTAKGKTLGILWGSVFVFVAGALACIWGAGRGYQIDRIRAFFAPWSVEAGEEQKMLRRAVAESHFLGAGSWAGKVPDYGDGYSYMMTHVAVSYGILAALLLAGLILALFVYFLRVSLRQRNQLGMIMGTGCVLVLLAQTLLYLLINGGWAVYGSVYCPFLTYGGTGMLVTDILLGILLSIYRYENVPLVMPDMKRRFLKIR